MENRNTAGNRLIEIKNGVVGPVDPRPVTIRETTPADYPGLPQAYFDVAEAWGPKFGGPPLCDEWVAVLKHLFTEEEASALRHLNRARHGKTAAEIAEAENRPVDEIKAIMDGLAFDKFIIMTIGNEEDMRYLLQPILPGAWETIVIRPRMADLNDFQKKFIELFLPLYETGFTTLFLGRRKPGIRYLPVGQSIRHNQRALPADISAEIFQNFDDFALGLCQCRMGAELAGNSCGRPMDNCLQMGAFARHLLTLDNRMRRIDRQEAIDIKVEAEESGLVSWTSAMPGPDSNSSCSCCGCCCMMMRTISEFNAPGYIAPPLYIPQVDNDKCTYCGKCAKACPMGAMTVDTKSKTRSYAAVRCVGCGLCYAACDKEKAIELIAVHGKDTSAIIEGKMPSSPLDAISGIKID
ncbi:MAG: 4Fe-4S binding protein [Deltaproteobacteria bacterium]|nr:4Fe-4S binding protein [Deltaproteobacteria bacterium]